jgi:hypothetical protein
VIAVSKKTKDDVLKFFNVDEKKLKSSTTASIYNNIKNARYRIAKHGIHPSKPFVLLQAVLQNRKVSSNNAIKYIDPETQIVLCAGDTRKRCRNEAGRSCRSKASQECNLD